jgi:type II secretory pathway pseudopilin PulG
MLVIAAYEMRPPHRLADQGGMAVVVALLVLALLSLLGITLMGLSVTESQIGSNEADLKKAFFAAEAGIQEAMYRMRLDPDTSTDENDPTCSPSANPPPDPLVIGKQGTPAITWADPNNASFWYYNPPTGAACDYSYDGTPVTGNGNYFGGTNKANLDSAGRTFTSSGVAHATGGALANANLGNGASYTVTVAPVVGYVSDGVTTCWQYVNQSGAPLRSCADVAPNPIFKVTSTGSARDGKKVLSTMIRRLNIDPKPDAPLTANSDVDVTSASAVIDGRNYDCNGTSLVGTGNKEAVAAPPKPPPNETQPDITSNNPGNLVCEEGGTVTNGVENCGTIRTTFPSTIAALLLGYGYGGATVTPQQQAEIDVLAAYLESIKTATGPPENGPPFHGIVYVNGNYTQPPDLSSGILIVHNASNTANLGNWNGGNFNGLVIADQINKINGNVTVIGSIFGWGSAGTVEVDITAGTPTLRYSKCVLDGLSQYFPFQIVKGTWHEQ